MCDRELGSHAGGWPIHPIELDRLGVVLEQCNPTKTGYESMAKLLGVAVGGVWGHGAHGAIMNSWCRPPKEGEAPNATLLSTLMVRNPYERLLSAYLGQVAVDDKYATAFDPNAYKNLLLWFRPSAEAMRPTKHPQSQTRGDWWRRGCNQSAVPGRVCSGYGEWQASPTGFADFVRGLTTAAKASDAAVLDLW